MSRKIVKYKLLTDNCTNGLSDCINSNIVNGWEPYGSPFSTANHFHQAIVKYEEINISCDPGMIKVLL